MTHTVLFELGCEELPPKSLKSLSDALKQEVERGLTLANLSFESITAYAAPRRLALSIQAVAGKQADSEKRVDGPAVAAAYDAEGKPTKALDGFLRGQGVAIDQLTTFNNGKIDKVCYLKQEKGQLLDQLLPEILQNALDKLPIAKRMRSGSSRTEFVRPVQWVLLLKDDQVIDATIQDFKTANLSYGHRFHAPQAITIKHANDYLKQLESAKVIASFEARQQIIDQQVKKLADEVNATAIVPSDLRDEVTSLVEFPVALRASFEQRYLEVPQEALILTMQDNQKYFCLVDAQQKLLPYFITISNIESKEPAQIIAGNEKVVRPRLADAEFFYLQDQKQPLASRKEKLKKMVFQAELGTLWQKTERVAKLSVALAKYTGAQAVDAEKAAFLSKCDLTSELVGEFPELQGIAGTYYARLEGENDEVANALAEHYLPKFAGDQLPQTKTGVTIALADRLVTLVGIFGIGQIPTGSKDPFALRRSAIGILRLIIENKLDVTLETLIKLTLEGYAETIKDHDKTLNDALSFLQGRYRAKYEDQGVDVDVIQSVQALSPKSPLDFEQRIKAVNHFRTLPEATALAAANKRVANILAKDSSATQTVIESKLVEPSEIALYKRVTQLSLDIQPLLANHDYTKALSMLAELRQPIDSFFEHVMVMDDDAELKASRLGLLAQLRGLFLSVADISLLRH